ncbi:MAG: protein BatD [bacterium]|nr:protein BatD [bacterium]
MRIGVHIAAAFLLAVSLAPTAHCAAELGVTAVVTVDPAVVPFHRPTTFTVTVEGPDDMSVDLPGLDAQLQGLGISGVPDIERTSIRGGRQRYVTRYVLSPVFAGEYPVPPITIQTESELTGEQMLVVPSPAVQVRDLTVEEQELAEQFNPIMPLIDPPLPIYARWPFWAAVVPAIGLAVWGIAYLLSHRRRVERAAPPVLPWDRAYDRLRGLDRQKLPSAGQFEQYYVELSAILREYIEERFLVHAPEQTTPEFLAEAAQNGMFNDVQQAMLEKFLRHSDRVKFARYEPSLGQMEESFATVLTFVDETKPSVESAAEDAA